MASDYLYLYVINMDEIICGKEHSMKGWKMHGKIRVWVKTWAYTLLHIWKFESYLHISMDEIRYTRIWLFWLACVCVFFTLWMSETFQSHRHSKAVSTLH